MRVKWKCKLCGDIVVSDSSERHKLDKCKCEKSFMDLEEGYCRQAGSPEVIEEIR
jgi:hypothetical protein